MSFILNEPAASDMMQQRDVAASNVALEKSRASLFSAAIAPVSGTCVVTYGTSTLVNASGTDASGRKHLTIKNPSFDTVVRYGSSSTSAIFESGKELLPGCSVTIDFESDSYPIYARAMGYSVTLEVEES